MYACTSSYLQLLCCALSVGKVAGSVLNPRAQGMYDIPRQYMQSLEFAAGSLEHFVATMHVCQVCLPLVRLCGDISCLTCLFAMMTMWELREEQVVLAVKWTLVVD